MANLPAIERYRRSATYVVGMGIVAPRAILTACRESDCFLQSVDCIANFSLSRMQKIYGGMLDKISTACHHFPTFCDAARLFNKTETPPPLRELCACGIRKHCGKPAYCNVLFAAPTKMVNLMYAYAYVENYVKGNMTIVDGEVFTSEILPPKDDINLCWCLFQDEESAEQFADYIADTGIFEYPN